MNKKQKKCKNFCNIINVFYCHLWSSTFVILNKIINYLKNNDFWTEV